MQTGVNGRGWAWMGLYGCDGVRAHGGTEDKVRKDTNGLGG